MLPDISQIQLELKRHIHNFIIDIDETIFNPLPKWQQLIYNYTGILFEEKDIEYAGSIDNYFKKTPFYPQIRAIAQKLRFNKELYKDAPLLPNAQNILNCINNKYHICAYLSARPLTVLDITIQEFIRHNLPLSNFILRNNDVNFYNSISWKISIISSIIQNDFKYLFIIDDNFDFINQINILKKKMNVGNKLITILFDGPLSHVLIRKKKLGDNFLENFYVSDWARMPNILEKFS